MRTSPQYNLKYTTESISLSRFLEDYDAIWTSAMYVRAWWWPYTRKVVIWRGDRTESPPSTAAQSALAKWYSSSVIDRYVYQSSLYALRYKPSLLPSFEKAIFRTKFPAKENVMSTPLVGKSHDVLQMDCLFSQYVDEWAVPLSSGVEAISRLDRWITNNDTSNTGIPVDTDKVFVHAPIEIRVSSGKGDHAFLSPARESTPVIWIGVIMYRPYFTPTAYRRYFAAYEHLMRSLGGKPHWAKQHSVSAAQAENIFGNGMTRWLAVRARVDPTGVFVNGFVKRHLLGVKDKESLGVGILDGEVGRLHKRFNAVL
jgi:D-arabinono-1,4-lactone oxidase